MISHQIARLIANVILNIDPLGDHPDLEDRIVEILEHISHDLQEIDPSFLAELSKAFRDIAPEYPEQFQQDVRDIPDDFHLDIRDDAEEAAQRE
ncbi:hypothetical protein [Sphingomonas sp. 2SG]|jgi:hypothetical protein|uniref:hypothetical protein n=1 Tax=Sphingomonas sp. 2SG TaxID=2502201 RepID=UPI0010F605D2|nr:hypothetical protein [Sphingomonas sp. 2SG]